MQQERCVERVDIAGDGCRTLGYVLPGLEPLVTHLFPLPVVRDTPLGDGRVQNLCVCVCVCVCVPSLFVVAIESTHRDTATPHKKIIAVVSTHVRCLS